jgi:hypothetical protein
MDMGCEYYGYDRRAARRTRSRARHHHRFGFAEAKLSKSPAKLFCTGRVHAALLQGLTRLLSQRAVEQQVGQQPPGRASADRPCAPAATSPAASPPTGASPTASAPCMRACSPRTRRAAHMRGTRETTQLAPERPHPVSVRRATETCRLLCAGLVWRPAWRPRPASLLGCALLCSCVIQKIQGGFACTYVQSVRVHKRSSRLHAC